MLTYINALFRQKRVIRIDFMNILYIEIYLIHDVLHIISSKQGQISPTPTEKILDSVKLVNLRPFATALKPPGCLRRSSAETRDCLRRSFQARVLHVKEGSIHSSGRSLSI